MVVRYSILFNCHFNFCQSFFIVTHDDFLYLSANAEECARFLFRSVFTYMWWNCDLVFDQRVVKHQSWTKVTQSDTKHICKLTLLIRAQNSMMEQNTILWKHWCNQVSGLACVSKVLPKILNFKAAIEKTFKKVKKVLHCWTKRFKTCVETVYRNVDFQKTRHACQVSVTTTQECRMKNVRWGFHHLLTQLELNRFSWW